MVQLWDKMTSKWLEDADSIFNKALGLQLFLRTPSDDDFFTVDSCFIFLKTVTDFPLQCHEDIIFWLVKQEFCYKDIFDEVWVYNGLGQCRTYKTFDEWREYT